MINLFFFFASSKVERKREKKIKNKISRRRGDREIERGSKAEYERKGVLGIDIIFHENLIQINNKFVRRKVHCQNHLSLWVEDKGPYLVPFWDGQNLYQSYKQ